MAVILLIVAVIGLVTTVIFHFRHFSQCIERVSFCVQFLVNVAVIEDDDPSIAWLVRP